MSKTVDPKKTYVGVVENNDDPKKIGRCQIRVMDVFENLKLEDLPWASPWKDLNGNQFNVPDKGKVVTVVFENGNTNNPEYISSDHYNVNLEQKLQQLGKDDYLSMKSLLYDHKTQIYVNDSEGLKLDHKFNNVNIKEQSINVNLKDNFGKVNLGSQNSTQRAILGDNFTNWFDTFLNILMGAQGGSFLGNLAAPVVATPALMSHIQLYFQLKDPKLLSKNVYIVDNDSVTKQERTDKVTEGQKGDTWASTVDENKLTTKEDVKFTPTDGASSTTFDKPPVDAEKPLAPIDLAPKKADSHPDVDVLLELLRMKNYKIYDKPYELNIVSVRNQCLSEGDKYTDEFVDKLYALYKDDKGNWLVKQYVFSTVPGAEFTISDNWIKQSNMTSRDLSHWSTKVGQKITMKEYIKGPIVDNSTPDKNTNSVLGNLTNKGNSLVGDLTGKGSSLVGDLTGKGSSLVGNLTSLSSLIPMSDIKNLTSQGLDIDKVTNNLSKAKSLGIDLNKLTDINSLSKEDINKLTSNNINVVKLKSDLSLISSNTNLNINDVLKSLK